MQVAVVGSITVDIVASGMPVDLVRGDKQEVLAIDLYPGGGAINATAMLLDQGEQVRLLGTVGQDALGLGLCAYLDAMGVDTHAVRKLAGQQTGKAVVLVGPQGDASVLARRGANAYTQIHPQDLDVDLLYVAPLGAAPMDSLAQALAHGASRAACWAVNPSVACVRQPDEAFRCVWDRADVLSLNGVEAQMLAAVPAGQILADLPVAQATELAQHLQRRAGQAVLITLGAQGAVLVIDGQPYFEPARRVAVRSTVGAGDAFNARFAQSWFRRRDPVLALRQATQASAQILGQWAGNAWAPMWQDVDSGVWP
ncbi:carbohydrate kinase family protein [Alcaligenes sp. SDU_A2]|uniref:carbohydrate kinase family protein n=1 Tax=Alcaligenes sp. SDU_A2 TaxID=3136634 RepID=UPI00311EC64D